MTLALTSRPLDQLVPFASNARLHSDGQVAQIAASIREFGFNNPVLVAPDGTIIAGHGRVMAARKLGLETVPVIELPHLSDAQRRAYVIADQVKTGIGWNVHATKGPDVVKTADAVSSLRREFNLPVNRHGRTLGRADDIEAAIRPKLLP